MGYLFCDLTLVHVCVLFLTRTEAVERSMMLRTKAMREKEEKREMRKYKYAVIRIRFPDGVLLQVIRTG
jgi:UBX domain-containing protein 6